MSRLDTLQTTLKASVALLPSVLRSCTSQALAERIYPTFQESEFRRCVFESRASFNISLATILRQENVRLMPRINDALVNVCSVVSCGVLLRERHRAYLE
jgi:hypothetical protein